MVTAAVSAARSRAVLAVDVLHDLFATLMLEIDVDIVPILEARAARAGRYAHGFALVRVRDRRNDGEPEAAAAGLRVVDTRERLENMRREIGRDAGTVVLDAKAAQSALDTRVDPDRAGHRITAHVLEQCQ